MRSLLHFVAEPYSAKCLEPLSERINSSNVPADFDPRDPATDPIIVDQARELSDLLQNAPQPPEGSTDIAKNLETEFNQRVEYFYDLSGRPRFKS
jgi:hypothetical protein